MGQLMIGGDGLITDKVQTAINRLKAFEPEEGYFVAFSGGKDSQCIYHLCKMAGVKFDAHYSVTSVDPPELVRFIRKNYPDVSFDIPHYEDDKPEHLYPNGKPRPITMWSLIAEHTLPPTRKVRYCCAALKEPNGKSRVVVTGVRWAESVNRKNTHGVVGFQGKQKKTRLAAEKYGAEFKLNKHGDVIMNDDNDAARKLVESCYRNRKVIVNPIVDWTEEDVWNFIHEGGWQYCSLYDEGFTRLGCIGCPLSGTANMQRDFQRWPKYRENYLKAFQRMIVNHPGGIKVLQREYVEKEREEPERDGRPGWVEPPAEIEGGVARPVAPYISSPTGFGTPEAVGGGGTIQQPGQKRLCPGGSISNEALLVFSHWVEMGAV